jgi:hypothetical protein
MMQKTSWGELSRKQQTTIIILSVFQVGLLVLTLWDLAHRRPEEVRGSRKMWVGIAFIDWIGPMAYFCYGRRPKPKSKMRRVADTVTGTAGTVADSLVNRAGSVASTASNVASTVGSTVGNRAGTVTNSVTGKASRLYDLFTDFLKQ